MKEYKAIIFDMDGTIFDTEKLYLDILKQVLKKYDVDITDEQLVSLVGKRSEDVIEFVENCTPKEKHSEILALYKGILNDYLKEYGTPIKYGLNNLIDYALGNGMKLAVATSADRKFFDLNFDNSGLDISIFDSIMTVEDVENAKPNGEIYEKTYQKLGLKAEDCLVIEDSYIGATAGKNAGCIVALVKDMEKTNLELDKTIDLKFFNLNEVVDYLKFCKIDCTKEVHYNGNPKEVYERIISTRDKLKKLNNTKPSKFEKREKIVRKILGKCGEKPYIISPFYCDEGVNVSVGKNFFANFGVCFVDCGKITIGDNCRFGPYSGIYTVTHDFEPKSRIAGGISAKDVYIGNNVWLGAGVKVLSGVKIGDNAIVGAGSVVCHDVMPNTIVAGCPAKFLKFIL